MPLIFFTSHWVTSHWRPRLRLGVAAVLLTLAPFSYHSASTLAPAPRRLSTGAPQPIRLAKLFRSGASGGSSEPWTEAQVVKPGELAKVVADPKAERPVIFCVGFRPLYEKSHISGASYAGPGREAKGLADLRQAVESLPRNKLVVLYCGCCPWDRCPNIRPAFEALQHMGFTRIEVLEIPDTFVRDWVEKGYPIEKP